jgi:hypothetical protein
MKHALISVGAIPGRLDSVKYITNRFKGGLAAKTANMLAVDFRVTIVKWRHTDLGNIDPSIAVIDVDDIYDYMDKVLATKADAYILAAAVANLIPAKPWEGKFPSHKYEVGEIIDIPFVIAPRIIDAVKAKYPRSTLIGYKLFDGPEEELVAAGWHTLVESKSNCVFCNHPATAKTKKIALLPDGSAIPMDFIGHVEFMRRLVDLEWYRTEIVETEEIPLFFEKELAALLARVTVDKPPYSFGTVASRLGDGIVTTTRGKRDSGFCVVENVDQESRVVRASAKATLNAPFLFRLLKESPFNYIVHGHKQFEGAPTIPYAFPGTTEEDAIDWDVGSFFFNIEHHGYVAMFGNSVEAMEWSEKYGR